MLAKFWLFYVCSRFWHTNLSIFEIFILVILVFRGFLASGFRTFHECFWPILNIEIFRRCRDKILESWKGSFHGVIFLKWGRTNLSHFRPKLSWRFLAATCWTNYDHWRSWAQGPCVPRCNVYVLFGQFFIYVLCVLSFSLSSRWKEEEEEEDKVQTAGSVSEVWTMGLLPLAALRGTVPRMRLGMSLGIWYSLGWLARWLCIIWRLARKHSLGSLGFH